MKTTTNYGILSFLAVTLFFGMSSCSDRMDVEDSTDITAPIIAEVTAVTTPSNDPTPNYTFSSDEAGTITYGG